MLADYHVHSYFSNDSTYPMEEVVQRGIQLGIEELCFTEHVDYFTDDNTHLVDYEAYHQEFKRLKAKYQGQISLKFGAEFGMQHHVIHEFQKDFSNYPFDFIILSNHQMNDQELWTGDFQREKTQEVYHRDYYQAILEVMRTYKDYSVLGHLDMIKRYDRIGILPDEVNEALIKEILRQAIADGKGIEVNTSNFRYQLPDLTPSRTILKWYEELGGTILTLGSDSHQESHLGFKLIDIKEELKQIGFKEFCTFEKMKPIFHKL